MSIRKVSIALAVLLTTINFTVAQRAPRAGSGWINQFDANSNGTLERDEFIAGTDALFKAFDKNSDGAIDEIEHPKPPKRNGDNFAPPKGERRDGTARSKLPPFMMRDENNDGKINRAEFDENARRHFAALDANGDGIIDGEEIISMTASEDRRQPPRRDGFAPLPNVQFLGAELRFGDKLVKSAPFSAETIMENSRRLYDGSIVTTQNKGAIYRDSAGRTRHEQLLDKIGGFNLGNDAQQLIFITDAGEGTQYFLDVTRKTARKMPISGERPPPPPLKIGESKTESLGRKVLEGVNVEGSRTIIEISAGGADKDKRLQIVSERWFSPELQTVVMTRHLDPLMGEQVFRLVNIRRTEPSREHFVVPADYKFENDRRQPR